MTLMSIDFTAEHRRKCGECSLCCRLLPVRALGKEGGIKCKHQKFGKGCTVYKVLGAVAPECKLWSCRWLMDQDTADMSRPDRSHYVIDAMPDFVTLNNNETGETFHIPAIQVWCDPKYPDAHKDPALRAFLERRAAEEGACAIIRYSPKRGFVLFPPVLSHDGQWHEEHGNPVDRTHTATEIYEALS